MPVYKLPIQQRGAGAAAKSAGWLAKGIITKVIGGLVVTGAIVGTAIWAVPASKTADKEISAPAATAQHAPANTDNHITQGTEQGGATAASGIQQPAETVENNILKPANKATRETSGQATSWNRLQPIW